MVLPPRVLALRLWKGTIVGVQSEFWTDGSAIHGCDVSNGIDFQEISDSVEGDDLVSSEAQGHNPIHQEAVTRALQREFIATEQCYLHVEP